MPKRSEMYQTEREEVCKKLINILKLDANNSILLSELDEDIEKQMAILDMKDEVQQYFVCSKISTFIPNVECKRPYLNMIRNILRKQGYIFVSSDLTLKTANGPKKTKKYTIFRNTECVNSG